MRKNNTAIIFGSLFFSCSVMAANGTLAPTVVPMVNGGQASIAISNTSPNLFTVPGDRIIAVNSLDGALTNNEQTASGGVVVATVNKKPFTFILETERGLNLSIQAVPRETHRKIRSAAADGAYDTRLCHDELRRKKISALIPPRKGAGYWPGEYADRNRAVANQRMTGSNARWKWTTDYNRRSIAETAMYRVKQLFGGSLTLRDYDGQVAEAMALVRALNKMTKAGMPESVRIA
ncbi:transposase [Escherichia coli]|uniref:transposase n=1 Tax=Escherichia coli TaxID=562 RepID=UPI003D245F0E